MKKVEAIIRPERLQNVQDALDELGVSGLTVSEVMGCGRQKGYTEQYRGSRANISLLPKIKVESVVPDSVVEPAVNAIVEAARTGDIGDGRVFVYPVEQAIRIRTGESGEETVMHAEAEGWGHRAPTSRAPPRAAPVPRPAPATASCSRPSRTAGRPGPRRSAVRGLPPTPHDVRARPPRTGRCSRCPLRGRPCSCRSSRRAARRARRSRTAGTPAGSASARHTPASSRPAIGRTPGALPRAPWRPRRAPPRPPGRARGR